MVSMLANSLAADRLYGLPQRHANGQQRSCITHRHSTIGSPHKRQHTCWKCRAVEEERELLEARLEDFMRRQAEAESGATTRIKDPTKILGEELMTEAEAKQMCRDVVQVIQKLADNRDMTFNEIRLILQIEDPRAREQRSNMDIEASSVSRDEIVAALIDISEGRVPRDRVALLELHREMVSWPFLDDAAPKRVGFPGSKEEDEDLDPSLQPRMPVAPPVGRDPNEKPQSLEDMLPDWMGYSALYAITLIPVFITITVVLILFLNSLR